MRDNYDEIGVSSFFAANNRPKSVEYYYHLTDANNITDIFRDGLIPKIGSNSASVDEQDKLIYLCKEKDIPYWALHTGKKYVLKVAINSDNKDKLKKYNYGSTLSPAGIKGIDDFNFSEYTYDSTILPKDIKFIGKYEDTDLFSPRQFMKIQRQVALSSLIMLSEFCATCADKYNNVDDKDDDYIKHLASVVIANISKLDYSVISKREIRQLFNYMNRSGDHTICDRYLNESYNLWQALIMYKADDLIYCKATVYQLIKTNIYPIIGNMEIGKYTV